MVFNEGWEGNWPAEDGEDQGGQQGGQQVKVGRGSACGKRS